MKALVLKKDGLRFEAGYPAPEPADGEALVRVRLAGICATDLELARGYMGFTGVPGHEFVGVVESGGEGLDGRRVVGEINCACGSCEYCGAGLGRHCPERSVLGIMGRDGAFAEYLALPRENLRTLPDGISDTEAVFLEPLAAACEILEQLDIGAEDSVLILGDGRLGLLVAQVLALRTTSLLAIGRHPGKLALLARRGIATATVAPARERFDVVVDCTGAADGLEKAMALVRPRGAIVLKTTVAGDRRLDLNRLVIDEVTLIGSRCGPFEPAMEALARGMVDTETLVSMIYPLEEGAEAFDHAREPGALKVLLKP
ncbi:MAG: alcohol dehydrogenase [Gaiellales bacterium]|nr:MAG: alcohol dehydrogenase [Gaiellales bacterium]